MAPVWSTQRAGVVLRSPTRPGDQDDRRALRRQTQLDAARIPRLPAGADACEGRRAMNGIHDMGGLHGFGPVEVEADEPVFHEQWEARVFGMVQSQRGNIDA